MHRRAWLVAGLVSSLFVGCGTPECPDSECGTGGGGGGGGGASTGGGSGGGGGVTDAGRQDAGLPDAGRPDAGAIDSGLIDAGSPDASVEDAGPTDAGTPDAGLTDAGAPDAGSNDAGQIDAGPGVPAAPQWTGSQPVSPANDNNPVLSGTAAPSSTIEIFTNATCTGTPFAQTTATTGGTFSVSVSVADNSTLTFRATATDSNGTSLCGAGFTYREDSAAPPAPVISGTVPAGPANDNAPLVSGSDSEPSVQIRIFASSACLGTPLQSGVANASGLFGISVSVSDDTLTNLTATAIDAAGNESPCSNSVPYIEDSTPTSPPVVMGFTPASPANNNAPLAQGTAPSGATLVHVYRQAGCVDLVGDAPVSNGVWSLAVAVADDSMTQVSASAVDAARNVSGCSVPALYFEDSTDPARPVVVSVVPIGPANENNPVVSGTAEASSTVHLFLSASCTTSVGSGPATAQGQFSIPATVPNDAVSRLYAQATDAAGNTSSCSTTFVSFTEDSTAPSAPVFTTVTPTGPSNNNSPVVSGSAEAGSTVRLFQNSTCQGTASATVIATGGTWSSPTNVPSDQTTVFSATATDPSGNASPCTPTVISYVEDSTPPTVPTFTGVLPSSPANNNSPRLSGTGDAFTTVRVYFSGDCTGLPAVTPGVISNGTWTSTVTVGDDTTTVFSLSGVDAAGNVSACQSNTLTYVEDSTPPAVPTVLSATPLSPSSNNNPVLSGGSGAGTTAVRVYGDVGCTVLLGTAIPTGGPWSFAATVLDDTTTTFKATAVDAAGNASACSTTQVVYVEDSTAPNAPVLTGTTPVSPSGSNTPSVSGTGEPGTSVRLFSSSTCLGQLATGTVLAGGTFAITLGVGNDSTTTIYAQLTDTAGNVSPCSTAGLTYVEDSTPPSAPMITSFPASPANQNNPILMGTGEAGTTIELSSLSSCGGALLGSTLVGVGGSFSLPFFVPDNSNTTLYIRARDAASNTSSCVGIGLYVEDSLSPPAPVLNASSPPSPADHNSPTLFGTSSEVTAQIRLYGQASCAGSILSTTYPNGAGSFSFSTSVFDNTTTSFSVMAVDAAGNFACSTSPFVYVEDSAPPAPPVLVSTNPASPALNTTPVVSGTAEAGASVRLYFNAACAGAPAASGVATGGAFSIAVTVLAGRDTKIYGAASDALGHGSNCSTALNYSEISLVASPVYASPGSDWNEYVLDDGASRFTASGTPCLGSEDGYGKCIHGGVLRSVRVPGQSSCNGLTAVDALGAFVWRCDSTTNPVRFFSTGLAPGKNLSDLLDLAAVSPAWKANQVVVSDGGGPIFTSGSTVWWANPVLDFPGVGSSLAAGTIYTVRSGGLNAGTVMLNAPRVALVVKPGVTLRNSSANQPVVRFFFHPFQWFEGAIDATGGQGVDFLSSTFFVVRNVSVFNSNGPGLTLGSARSGWVRHVSVMNSGSAGISGTSGCDFNLFEDLQLHNLTFGGISMSGVHNTVLNASISAAATGITWTTDHDNLAQNVTLTNVNSSGSSALHSIYSHQVWRNAVLANVQRGLEVNGAATVENLVATNNATFGVMASGTPSYFTGDLRFGANGAGPQDDCLAFSGGGLTVNGSNQCLGAPPSDFVASMQGRTLASAFMGKVTSDDVANSSDTNGAATYASTLDWLKFDHRFRAWGNEGAAFPDSGNRGRCAGGPCRIWDWRPAAGDLDLRATNPCPSGLPSATLSHTYFDGTSFTALRNAWEQLDDGVGDEDGLCEAFEVCVFAQNKGAYQGSGPLVAAPAGCLSTPALPGIVGLVAQSPN